MEELLTLRHLRERPATSSDLPHLSPSQFHRNVAEEGRLRHAGAFALLPPTLEGIIAINLLTRSCLILGPVVDTPTETNGDGVFHCKEKRVAQEKMDAIESFFVWTRRVEYHLKVDVSGDWLPHEDTCTLIPF